MRVKFLDQIIKLSARTEKSFRIPHSIAPTPAYKKQETGDSPYGQWKAFILKI